MAWAYVQTIEDLTIEQYDQIAAALEENPPDGLIVHAAGVYRQAVRIIDVWESEAHFERFREHQLATALKEAADRDTHADYPTSLEPMDVHHMILGH